MGLDLAKVNFSEKAEVGYEFELRMPGTDEPLGAFIKVRGVDSPKVKAYGKKVFREMQVKEAQAKRKGREPDQITIEEAEDLAIESAVVRTIGWRGIEEDGKEVKFSEENAARIYREYPFIRTQVMDESDQLLNFI